MMLNRISAIILIMTIILSNGIAVSADNYVYGSPRKNAAAEMEKFDIVRNPFERWGEHDYITRRDALKIAYIMKYVTRSTDISSIKDAQESVEDFLINANRKQRFEFVDISEENYDDYIFVATMFVSGLLHGREENGLLYADLDGYVTYNEAFAYVFRLFMRRYMSSDEGILNTTSKTPYYDFCNDVNLINSKNPFEKNKVYLLDRQVINVSEEQLDDYIEAYDFLLLMYKALYLIMPAEEGATNYYLINVFYDFKQNNKKFLIDDFIND